MAEQAGVWVVAYRHWIDGPGEVTPYATELDALRAANREDYVRVWFVPFGKDLRDVMNEPYATSSQLEVNRA